MPRYIDADAIHYVEIGKGVEIALASDIDKMPTLSPDEARGVVHCCNCYHAEPRNPVGEKTEIFCRLFIAGMRDDDFCSRGEFLTNCGARMEVSEDA